MKYKHYKEIGLGIEKTRGQAVKLTQWKVPKTEWEKLGEAIERLKQEIIDAGVFRDLFLIWFGMLIFAVLAFLTGNLTL